MTGLESQETAQSGKDRAAANLCCNGERDVLDDFATREAAEADDGREAAQVVAEQRHVRRLHRYRGPCAGFDSRFKISNLSRGAFHTVSKCHKPGNGHQAALRLCSGQH